MKRLVFSLLLSSSLCFSLNSGHSVASTDNSNTSESPARKALLESIRNQKQKTKGSDQDYEIRGVTPRQSSVDIPPISSDIKQSLALKAPPPQDSWGDEKNDKNIVEEPAGNFRSRQPASFVNTSVELPKSEFTSRQPALNPTENDGYTSFKDLKTAGAPLLVDDSKEVPLLFSKWEQKEKAEIKAKMQGCEAVAPSSLDSSKASQGGFLGFCMKTRDVISTKVYEAKQNIQDSLSQLTGRAEEIHLHSWLESQPIELKNANLSTAELKAFKYLEENGLFADGMFIYRKIMLAKAFAQRTLSISVKKISPDKLSERFIRKYHQYKNGVADRKGKIQKLNAKTFERLLFKQFDQDNVSTPEGEMSYYLWYTLDVVGQVFSQEAKQIFIDNIKAERRENIKAEQELISSKAVSLKNTYSTYEALLTKTALNQLIGVPQITSEHFIAIIQNAHNLLAQGRFKLVKSEIKLLKQSVDKFLELLKAQQFQVIQESLAVADGLHSSGNNASLQEAKQSELTTSDNSVLHSRGSSLPLKVDSPKENDSNSDFSLGKSAPLETPVLVSRGSANPHSSQEEKKSRPPFLADINSLKSRGENSDSSDNLENNAKELKSRGSANQSVQADQTPQDALKSESLKSRAPASLLEQINQGGRPLRKTEPAAAAPAPGVYKNPLLSAIQSGATLKPAGERILKEKSADKPLSLQELMVTSMAQRNIAISKGADNSDDDQDDDDDWK